MDRQKLAAFSFLVAFMLVAFLAALLVFVSVGFFAGWPITKIEPLLAAGVVLILPFVLKERFVDLNRRWKSAAVALFIAVLVLLLLTAVSVIDFSCDGQGYHGTAIYQLLDGWNPIYQPGRTDAPQSILGDAIVHYPKGSWYSAAALCTLVGKAEAGKATTMLFIAAAFFLALYATLRYSRLGLARSLILSALVALNPISLNQCLTYYVDGQVGALFTILVLSSCLLLRERGPLNIALIAFTILILINVKHTALVYGVVFGAAFALALCVLKEIKALPSLAKAYALGFLLGLIVGYNPYVTNIRETGSPLYPFTFTPTKGNPKGNLQENLEVHQMPVTFRDRNRVDVLMRSIFGRCNNDYDWGTETFTGGPLKIPFTVGADEIACFKTVDTRVSGWGPLTSGILLASLIGFFLRKEPPPRMFVVLVVCILATILAVPHTWNARYVPQLWLLPVMTVAVWWIGHSRRQHFAAAFLVILMFANLAMVSIPCFHSSYVATKNLRAQLRSLAAQDRVYSVAFGDYQFNRLRLREYGIRFRAVDALPPQAKQLMLAGDTSSKTLVSLGD